MEKIKQILLENVDTKCGDFIHRLIPTLPRTYFLGVKTPKLKQIVKKMSLEEKTQFINELPHEYYEENMIHGFIISGLKDYDLAIREINRFLPYVNNWATSDTMYPKIFKRYRDKLINEIKRWLQIDQTYTIRFAIDMLMVFYLDEYFNPRYFDLINAVINDDYYVKMMKAWYYSTALIKQYETTIKIFESKTLSKWIHNKAIQKAIESFRVSDEHKTYLKSLKQ